MFFQQTEPSDDFLPQLARPARRALAKIGIKQLEQLTHFTQEQLSQLHGIGPKALEQLHDALRAEGLDFADPKQSL